MTALAQGPRPTGSMPFVNGTSTGPVTIRMMIVASEPTLTSRIIDNLAREVYAQPVVQQIAGDGGWLEFLTYQAGLFEGQSMRLELVAIDGDASFTCAAAGLVDVLILVGRSPSRERPSEGVSRLVDGWAHGADPFRPALLVLAHRDGGAPLPDPAELVRHFDVPESVPSAAISSDGSGVRYGFALAVRSGLQRLRARDAVGQARSAAMSADELALSLSPHTDRVADIARALDLVPADIGGEQPAPSARLSNTRRLPDGPGNTSGPRRLLVPAPPVADAPAPEAQGQRDVRKGSASQGIAARMRETVVRPALTMPEPTLAMPVASLPARALVIEPAGGSTRGAVSPPSPPGPASTSGSMRRGALARLIAALRN